MGVLYMLLQTINHMYLFKKSLVDASACLTHMLMQLLDYTLNVHYQPGERMHISNALSRLSSHNMAAGKTIKTWMCLYMPLRN